MSIDYLGAQKIKAHEEGQDEAISSGGSGLPKITTSEFIMDPSGSVPLPVIDDVKELGMYLVQLDLSSMAPGMGMSYLLTVANMGAIGQILKVSSTNVVFNRIFENNEWSDWADITAAQDSTVLQSHTGYDSSKTQTLKNVKGVITWVDDE